MTFARAAPSAHAADAAMSRARRRSRAPAGRTERRSRRGHHPGHRPGKVRADAPRDTRRTRYGPAQETAFALPQKGEYGGAGGVEGEPLSLHAPRRAGDLPPAPGSSRRPGKKNNNGNNNDDTPAAAGAKKGCPYMTDILHSNAGEENFLPLRQKTTGTRRDA